MVTEGQILRSSFGRLRMSGGALGKLSVGEDAMDDFNYWQRMTGRRLARRALLRSGGIAAAGIGVATLIGCASKSASSGKANTGAATGGSGAGQPQRGGILSHRLPTDPPTLDIHQASTYVAIWDEAPCYNQLLQWDP